MKILIILTAALAAMMLLALGARGAFANGNENGPQFGGTSTSSASSGAVAAAGAVAGAGALSTSDISGIGGSATIGGSTTNNKTTAYAVGGTGLTSTAPNENGPAQGSTSVAFGAFATTFVSESAALRYYAQKLCPRAPDPQQCAIDFACLDDEAPDAMKSMLKCKGRE